MTRFVKARLILSLGLFSACLGLGWIIYQDLAYPPHYARSQALKIPASKAIPGLAEQTQFSMPPISAFRETVQRPLFSQSRRPPESQRAVKTATSVTPPELKVMGIVFSPTQRIAFISPQDKNGRSKTKPLLLLNEGAYYEGWTVDEIARDGVTLRQDETRVNFELDYR